MARKSRDCRPGCRKQTVSRLSLTLFGMASQIDRRRDKPGKFSALLTCVWTYTTENGLSASLGQTFSAKYLFNASTVIVLAENQRRMKLETKERNKNSLTISIAAEFKKEKLITWEEFADDLKNGYSTFISSLDGEYLKFINELFLFGQRKQRSSSEVHGEFLGCFLVVWFLYNASVSFGYLTDFVIWGGKC